jgi:hypothetical protein
MQKDDDAGDSSSEFDPQSGEFLAYYADSDSEDDSVSTTEKMGLQKIIYKTSDPVGLNQECHLCFMNYVSGDKQVKLKCNCIFHITCIDKWLRKLTTCPVCKERQPYFSVSVLTQGLKKMVKKFLSDKAYQALLLHGDIDFGTLP